MQENWWDSEITLYIYNVTLHQKNNKGSQTGLCEQRRFWCFCVSNSLTLLVNRLQWTAFIKSLYIKIWQLFDKFITLCLDLISPAVYLKYVHLPVLLYLCSCLCWKHILMSLRFFSQMNKYKNDTNWLQLLFVLSVKNLHVTHERHVSAVCDRSEANKSFITLSIIV